METNQLIFLNTAGGVLGFCWLIGWCLISLLKVVPFGRRWLHRTEAGSLTFFAQARCRASRWWHRHCCGTNSPCGSNTGPLNQQEPGVWLGWVRVSVFNDSWNKRFFVKLSFLWWHHIDIIYRVDLFLYTSTYTYIIIFVYNIFRRPIHMYR